MRVSLVEVVVLVCIVIGFAVPLFAQENEARHLFSGKVFQAGGEVRITEPVAKDLCAAGETVTVDNEVRETAHIARRRVRVNCAVGENLYAAGYTVDIDAPVGRDVIAASILVASMPSHRSKRCWKHPFLGARAGPLS